MGASQNLGWVPIIRVIEFWVLYWGALFREATTSIRDFYRVVRASRGRNMSELVQLGHTQDFLGVMVICHN